MWVFRPGWRGPGAAEDQGPRDSAGALEVHAYQIHCIKGMVGIKLSNGNSILTGISSEDVEGAPCSQDYRTAGWAQFDPTLI